MFLARLWGPNFPVKPAQVALEFSQQCFPTDPITKVEAHQVDPGIEGILIRGKAWYILFSDAVTLQGRRNFTIAHELGHYLLHRQSETEFRCTQRDVLQLDNVVERRRESEANMFASYLLMPMDDFRRQVEDQTVSVDLLGHCADRYNVSLTATTLKWLEFTEDAAALVVGRDGFVLWSSGSAAARRRGFFWPHGSPLPPGSMAAAGSAFDREHRMGMSMPAGVWHPTEEAFEMKIESDRYEFSISLIRFPRSFLSPEHREEPTEDGYDAILKPSQRDCD